MATIFWQACFSEFQFLLFRSFYGVFIRFDFGRFFKDLDKQKSKVADQDGRRSEMITQLLHHVTSQPHDADVKGDIFRHTIYPPSVVAIACIFSELRGGGGGGGKSALLRS